MNGQDCVLLATLILVAVVTSLAQIVTNPQICRTSSECSLDGVGVECVKMHTPCDMGTCLCPDGMIKEDGQCVKESNLHEECQYSNQCTVVKNAICRDNYCTCRENTEEYHGQCKSRNTYKIGEECTENKECVFYSDYTKTLRTGICSDGKCTCPVDYIAEDDKCIYRFLGDDCTIDNHCGISASVCDDGVCQCKKGFRRVNKRICRLESEIGNIEAGMTCGGERKCKENLVCKKCHDHAKNKTCVYFSSGSMSRGHSVMTSVIFILVIVSRLC